ncbi:MAG: UPF0182 family protein [Cyanobacteria bacterium P01_D01_bin.73]
MSLDSGKRYWWRSRLVLSLGAVLLAGLGLDGLLHARVEGWWFDSLGYGAIFWQRFGLQVALFTIIGSLSWTWLWGNLNQALRRLPRRRSPDHSPSGLPEKWWVRSPDLSPPSSDFAPDPPKNEPPLNGAMPLGITIAIALVIIATLELLGLHYGSVAWESFQEATSAGNAIDASALDGLTLEPIPARFDPQMMVNRLGQIMQGDRWQWWLAAAIAVGIGLLLRPAGSLTVLALGQSLGFAWIVGHHWQVWLLAAQAVPFNQRDPLLELDIGTYVFSLPLLDLINFWLIGLVALGLLSVLLVDLLARRTLERGYFAGLTVQQQRHGYRLLGWLLVAIASSLALSCLELVYSPRGVTYGASFTDVWVQFPVNACLAVLAAVLGVGLLGYGFTGQRLSVLVTRVPRSRRRLVDTLPRPRNVVSDRRLPMETVLVGITFLTVTSVLTGIVLPQLVNAIVVKPNEIERERSFIARNIEYTRQGFGLEDIEVRRFDVQRSDDPGTSDLDTTAIASVLEQNAATIENIRLWDTQPLLESNRQLQQIRPYYRFASGDIDRYQLPSSTTDDNAGGDDTSLQQVILSLREIDPDSVPSQAQTWVNRHLAYTHGYGFTLSPVNKVDPSGLPQYFVKDISSSGPNTGALTVTPPSIRQAIPIEHPRIYYGELASTYVMAPSTVDEFDYPSGDTNAYNHYDGRGGVQLVNPWRRLVFAWTLRDWQMLFARNLTTDTKVLIHRQIRERVRAIAPFLRYDSDPYGVVVDVGDAPDYATIDADAKDSNHLFWIVDAYTVSDRYPYSEPNAQKLNYIRNTVKVIVDAYDGTVRFYVADPSDPIIQTWQRLFPELFAPIDSLPPALRSHLRYGNDLLSIQSERLLTYHIDNPQAFYNRDDVWEVPSEVYDKTSQPVAPYFAILRLPGGTGSESESSSAEFVQLLPFSPVSRSNLVAWFAARSDGDNYGKLLLYQFPKDVPVFGVEQVEARINQTPEISEQISLWNREGSRAIQGNLLVIPLGNTLLYVEPVYLEAVEEGIPTLARVIVVHENQIVMKPSLVEALNEILQG